MSADSIKDNAQILADQEAFRAACDRARAKFEEIEGVVGVGCGLKQRKGTFGSDLAIVIFVEEKKEPEQVPAGQLIPPEFEGYATDVRTVPRLRLVACENTAEYKSIQGGIQITNKGKVTETPVNIEEELSLGTIACVVRKRNDLSRENVHILSNDHVIGNHGHGPGDYIYHPFPPKVHPSAPARDFVSLGPIQPGGTQSDIPYSPPGGGPAISVYVDCAIARLDIDSKCCGSTCTKDTLAYAESVIDLAQVTPNGAEPSAPQNVANAIADVRNAVGDMTLIGKTVTKVGRTTGKTQGRVACIASPITIVDPNNPSVVLLQGNNVIEIEFDVTATNCKGHAYFAEEGDSGSLVLDDQNRAVGLLFAGPLPNSPPGTVSCACHIVPVLDYLNICIPCISTGTSHGSTHATDGSGLAPSPLPPDTSSLGGLIGFTSQKLGGTLEEPGPLTQDEVSHMRELLDEFRGTPRGPELHAAFAEVRREVGYLVRNCRPVTVSWHRNQGPAFLTHVLNHLAGHSAAVPHEVKGVSRRELLMRMRTILAIHGSNPLREALGEYGDELLEVLSEAGTAHDCIARLLEKESV